MEGTIIAGIVLIVAVAAICIAKRSGPGLDLDTPYDLSEGERFANRWGYADTRFEFDGPRIVRVTGNRYPISGYRMPHFVPFLEEVVGMPVCSDDVNVERVDLEVTPPRLNGAFLDALKAGFQEDQYSLDPEVRSVHSHGQLSVDEVYRILYESSFDRTVDLVFYPCSEHEVRTVVRMANEHNVCLIPYGGGTNVSGALACPKEEQRMIVSLDTRRMNRILWIDRENLQACVEAGISGKQLEIELGKKGYTSGHDPDSIELSTLGGWIATNASGMKKNRYGNIEDIVLEATLVTPTGDIETTLVTPRNSAGVQPRAFLFGSEGNLGIITKAVFKIHPKPEVRTYGSLVFRSFENGVDCLRELRQNGIVPASIRLVNNHEFRFGMALRPAPSRVKGLLEGLKRFFLTQILGYRPMEMAACTILMEGTKEEVRQQGRAIFRTARKHGGISGGSSSGKRGYALTFGIAYIRDFCNRHHILGETFETSVPWNKIHQMCRAVQKELAEQAVKYQVPGKPFLSYRVTQTYHTGVCVYFTMGLYGKGLAKPSDVFSSVEHRLRQVILDNGGSLSHHHGVGKIRKDFLPQIQSENSINVLRQLKAAMDPNNVFGTRNGICDGSS